MNNTEDSSVEVAYESAPKEVRCNKGMPGNKQFPGYKMPQKQTKSRYYPANPLPLNRYGEYR